MHLHKVSSDTLKKQATTHRQKKVGNELDSIPKLKAVVRKKATTSCKNIFTILSSKSNMHKLIIIQLLLFELDFAVT